MITSLVIALIGRDRPGLVEQLARVVVENGGNWLESRMSHLGGHFAGVLRVQVPAARESGLRSALDALRSEGLDLLISADSPTAEEPVRPALQLEIIGQDRPGIVRQVARALASRGVNVEELTTERSAAPMSGEMLFRACARIHLPSGCNLSDLRDELDKVAGDMLVEVSLGEPEHSTVTAS